MLYEVITHSIQLPLSPQKLSNWIPVLFLPLIFLILYFTKYLPRKIWKDCVSCIKFIGCDEVAVARNGLGLWSDRSFPEERFAGEGGDHRAAGVGDAVADTRQRRLTAEQLGAGDPLDPRHHGVAALHRRHQQALTQLGDLSYNFV